MAFSLHLELSTVWLSDAKIKFIDPTSVYGVLGFGNRQPINIRGQKKAVVWVKKGMYSRAIITVKSRSDGLSFRGTISSYDGRRLHIDWMGAVPNCRIRYLF